MPILCFVLSLFLFSCESLELGHYAIEQGAKQGALLLKARPIEKVLADKNLDPQLRKRLKLSLAVLKFAESHSYKINGNYQDFVWVNRSWITQIVSAAPKDRLENYYFNFPIVGNVPYKGFYDEKDALDLARKLEAQGYDTRVRKVEAFSTAGWMKDPLFSTMIDEEDRLIELLFHELTHTTFYFKSHADFNEAFATWMGIKMSIRFAKTHPELLSDPEGTLASLENEWTNELKRASFIKKIKNKGHEFYNQKQDLEFIRKNYFSWIAEENKKEGRLYRVEANDWNNALIMALGTYYDMLQPIDDYAEKHHLTEKDFLEKVTSTGERIVNLILKHPK